MKKKKEKNKLTYGFTLVEMLTVIVLLGLLMAFLLPAISKYIIETRDETYIMYEANMKTAAQNMMNECIEKNSDNCVPKSGMKKRISLSELVSMGYTERLKDPKAESNECSPFDSFVEVTNDDSNVANLTYEVCLVCGDYKNNKDLCDTDSSTPECSASEDNEAPRCGVAVGASTVWTNKDRIITIGCSDDCTGCVQDTFATKVSTTTEKVTIQIADRAGKTSDCEVDAYVDKDAPTCELEVIGEIGDNGWYKSDTAPSVRFKSKEDSNSGIATYGLGTSKSNYDFNKEIEYIVKDGITTVYGYVKDNAGNVGTCSKEVRYDSVPPKIDNINYGTVIYPKEDISVKESNIIRPNDIIGEYGTIEGFVIYMNDGTGGTVRVMKNGSEITSATIPTSTSRVKHGMPPQRQYTGIYFEFGSETQANNVSRIELLTGNDSGYYTNQNVTLYINSMDSVSGKAQYSFDNGVTYQNDSFKTYTQLTSNIKMKASDLSGNITPTVTKSITNIDKLEPQCTVSFGSNSVTTHANNYYWDNVPVRLTKDDTAATTQYAESTTRYFGLKSSEGLEYNSTSTGTQRNDTTGHIWYGYVIDKAGNTANCNETVKKDSQDPTCTLTKAGTEGNSSWYRSDVTISFSEKKDINKNNSQSGIEFYQIDTSDSNPSRWTTEASDKQTSDTTTTGVNWYGHVRDYAGHTATCNINVKRDTVNPSCTLTKSGTVGHNSWYTSDVTISFATHTDALSGVDSYGIGSSTGSATATRSTDGASISYTGYITDNAGNTSSCSISFKRDATDPSCSITKTNTYTTGGVTATATCSDGTSGCTSTSDSASSLTSNRSFSFTDNAGNTGSCTATISSQTQYSIRTRTWNSCASGTPAYCDGGNVCSTVTELGCSYWPEQCAAEGGTFYQTSDTTLNRTGCCKKCTAYTWDPNINCHESTCSGAWNAWSSWSDYSASNSACDTNSCQSRSRTVYY